MKEKMKTFAKLFLQNVEAVALTCPSKTAKKPHDGLSQNLSTAI